MGHDRTITSVRLTPPRAAAVAGIVFDPVHHMIRPAGLDAREEISALDGLLGYAQAVLLLLNLG